jgi:hypothetical protein
MLDSTQRRVMLSCKVARFEWNRTRCERNCGRSLARCMAGMAAGLAAARIGAEGRGYERENASGQGARDHTHTRRAGCWVA